MVRQPDLIWWGYIIKYQKLSEDFVSNVLVRRWDKNLERMIPYQKNKLTELFLNSISEFEKEKYLKGNWLYKTIEFRKEQIEKCNLFECYDDYFVSQILVDKNRFRPSDFHYQLNKGKSMEIFATPTDDERPKGFEVGPYKHLRNNYFSQFHENSREYYFPIKVKVKYEDVVFISKKNYVLARCNKIYVME